MTNSCVCMLLDWLGTEMLTFEGYNINGLCHISYCIVFDGINIIII